MEQIEIRKNINELSLNDILFLIISQKRIKLSKVKEELDYSNSGISHKRKKLEKLGFIKVEGKGEHSYYVQTINISKTDLKILLYKYQEKIYKYLNTLI